MSKKLFNYNTFGLKLVTTLFIMNFYLKIIKLIKNTKNF